MIINQWLPTAHWGDAIGDSSRRVRGLLRSLGHQSDIYAMDIDAQLANDVLPFVDAGAGRGDVTIFHYGIQSPMTAAFAALPKGRVLQYHNITPAEFFAPYDLKISRLVARGREELASLVGSIDVGLADSEYNRCELEALGFGRTGVFPIAVDIDRVQAPARLPALEAMLDDGVDNVLFVGRMVPNKKIEDHIHLAALYSRHVDADCRFIFVGRCDVVPRYYSMVRALALRHGLRRDRIIFTGPVPDEELAIYYQHADVYLSLSEHEGFCVPLVEAMAAGVPVMAYAAAAVPDTLGGAGVQFAPKDLVFAAELLGELTDNDALRADVVAGQNRRLADFGDARISRELATLVGSLS